jgi:hypothetical protein
MIKNKKETYYFTLAFLMDSEGKSARPVSCVQCPVFGVVLPKQETGNRKLETPLNPQSLQFSFSD